MMRDSQRCWVIASQGGNLPICKLAVRRGSDAWVAGVNAPVGRLLAVQHREAAVRAAAAAGGAEWVAST